MEELKIFFKDKKVKTVLDAGTGTGDFIAVLREVFPDSEITGIDPGTASLAEARLKYPEIEFLEMGAENLNFENESFDLASISMALHHVTDVQKSLTELQRVVKPGGWILINELYCDNLNEAQETHKMYHHFRSRIDRLNGISHNETFQKSAIIRMVEKAGIQIELSFDNMITQEAKPGRDVLEEKLGKMNEMLEKFRDSAEYKLMKPEIENFRQRFLKFGFQSPPRIVIVGKIKA